MPPCPLDLVVKERLKQPVGSSRRSRTPQSVHYEHSMCIRPGLIGSTKPLFTTNPAAWHGTLDLPFDHGSPRRPAVGHGKRAPRCTFQLTLPVDADTAS